MPIPLIAQEMLANFADKSGEFLLFGIFINPVTGEMGTYSSHGLPPGQVLGFLQRSVETMVTAAANNELEYIGGDDATLATEAAGGNLVN